MSRSEYWTDVVDLVRASRERCAAFEPATGDPEECLQEGVEPIISLYVEARREGVELTDVERSLLEGALNDWLEQYARCWGGDFHGGFSVHEVSMAYADHGSLERTVRELLGTALPQE